MLINIEVLKAETTISRLYFRDSNFEGYDFEASYFGDSNYGGSNFGGSSCEGSNFEAILKSQILESRPMSYVRIIIVHDPLTLCYSNFPRGGALVKQMKD